MRAEWLKGNSVAKAEAEAAILPVSHLPHTCVPHIRCMGTAPCKKIPLPALCPLALLSPFYLPPPSCTHVPHFHTYTRPLHSLGHGLVHSLGIHAGTKEQRKPHQHLLLRLLRILLQPPALLLRRRDAPV